MAALTTLTAGILWWRERRIEAVFILVAVLGGELVGLAFKEVFMRVRPLIEHARIPMPESYSFPSGHALAALLYFASLAFVTLIDERRLQISVAIVGGCALAAITIALSRVYLGVHYLGDIVGAWLLGSAWLVLAALVFARFAAGDPTADASGPAEAAR
jgi:undecaprenyl-diphosphatase